jgi:hypothetical protein
MKLKGESGRDKNCCKDTGIWEVAQELDGSGGSRYVSRAHLVCPWGDGQEAGKMPAYR